MTDAAVILAAGAGERFHGPHHKLRSDVEGRALISWTLDAAVEAEFDEVVIVVGEDHFGDLTPHSVTVLHNHRWAEGQATSLHAAVEHADRMGHDSIVVSVADQPLVPAAAWRSVREERSTPIAVAVFDGVRSPPTRLARDVWPLLPASGDQGARSVVRANPDLVTSVPCPGDPIDVDTEAALAEVRRRAADRRVVMQLLGREPMGRFDVAVRDEMAIPIVLRNCPVLHDGRPMPTLYWLCGARESMLVGRLESMRGVRRAEAEIGLERIAVAHDRYRIERDAALDDLSVDPEHLPTGGVGGTRVGVKCLHAHYAWWLAGGDDPVGQWVADHLDEVDKDTWPTPALPEEVETDD